MNRVIKPVIQLAGVSKTYKTDAGNFNALTNIDLTIEPGQFVGIIGKSGSGKSTLINMITGIDRATSGLIQVSGTDITSLKEGDMAVWRGKHLGIVFQFFQLLPTLTVLENIMLPMDFCSMYKPQDRREKAMELLDLVELRDQADKFPSELSGGQQQRIAIARSLANDPPLIAADEPTGNLDSKTAEQIFVLFRDLVNRGKTIIMVTHDRDLANKVDRSIIISDGQVIEEYLISTFSTLTEQQLVWVTANVTTKDYAPGEVIIEEGKPTKSFFIIMNGLVSIMVKKNGVEKILESFGKGKYFGEIELIHESKSVASAKAGKHGARVGCIDKDIFNKILHDSPELKKKLYQAASEHLVENRQQRKK
jgi:ABC-type lipoprotein export system ATPase subunit